MNNRPEQALQGQIAVIFALMIVVLLGMAGLAIDVAHARTSAEDAQRAADAAALGGVIYLPSNVALANSQAAALATANGYTATSPNPPSNCTTNRGDICIGYNPNPPARTMQVTITSQVPTSFLSVLGYGYITVTRSSTATYDDPIALGAPDHMLGMALYQTRAIVGSKNATVANPYPWGQGFYLENRGPATGLEHGDAFSPFFATLSGDSIMTVGGGGAGLLIQSTCSGFSNPKWTMIPFNQCQETSTGGAGTTTLKATPDSLQPNPYYNQNNQTDPTTSGYNYSFSLPANMQQPVIIKINDPYDNCFDGGTDYNRLQGLTVNGPDGSGGTSPVSTELIDQCGPQYWGEPNGNGIYQTAQYPTALKLTLSQPYLHLVYPLLPITAPGTSTYDSDGTGGNVTVNLGPVGNGQVFSVDPTGGAHGFQWFSLASVQNTTGSILNMRLTVQSVGAPDPQLGNKLRYGQAGNNYSLAICKSNDGTLENVGDPANLGAWLNAARTPGEGFGAAVNQDIGCADPNFDGLYDPVKGTTSNSDGYGCPINTDGSINVTCYHVNAIGAFCIETLQRSAGPAYIPLAQVDQHYAGSTISIRLYDAGDVSGGTNTINILGPTDDPAVIGTSNTSQPYGLDISAPYLSKYSQIGQGRASGGPNAFMYQQGCNDYNAMDYGPTGPLPTDPQHIPGTKICPPLTGTLQTTGVQVANPSSGNKFANDTWLTFHVSIPSTYKPALNNQWWKVFYNLVGSGATDTTTWQVVSGASPVHLISQQ